MGPAELGVWVREVVITAFHAWTYIAAGVASGLVAGLFGWIKGHSKGYDEGRAWERKKQFELRYENDVRRGRFRLRTPRPEHMDEPEQHHHRHRSYRDDRDWR